jgi:hypothetical protein
MRLEWRLKGAVAELAMARAATDSIEKQHEILELQVADARMRC